MDTGSTGVVVSASAIPGFEQFPKGGPAMLSYTSSGRIMRGVWVTVPVTIAAANGASFTTRPIPVLAVTSIDCTETARSCTPRDDPRYVAMVGVGFGPPQPFTARGNRRQQSVSQYLGRGHTRLASRVHRDARWRADRRSHRRPAGPYATVRLPRSEETGEWSGAPACIAVEDHAPACGSVLLDTGVTNMFLAVPPDRVERRALATGGDHTLPPGTKIAIALAPATPDAKATAVYSFAVGDQTNPLAPRRVLLVGRGDRPTFVNTSVNVLNGFD